MFIQDLIPVVIECGAHWWPRDLANLCTVSTSWLHPARRVLYQYPQLTTYSACSLLARSLRENKHLHSLLNGVCLCPMPDYSNATRQTPCVDSLRTILAMDNLRYITLGGELSIAAERFLHMVTNPGTVINLRIDGGLMMGALQPIPSLAWDESIALKFANLRSLDLSNLTVDIDMDAFQDPSKIRTLIVDNIDICHGRLVSLVGAGGSLEHLSVTASDTFGYDEEIREVLELCAVRSLTYRVKEKQQAENSGLFGSDMGPLPVLREIETEGVYVDREVVAQLCPALERLEVVGT